MRSTQAYLLGLLLVAAMLPTTAGARFEPLELWEAAALMEELGGTARHPNANSVIGFDHQYIEFDERGAYDETHHTFIKILTDEGLNEHGDESIIYHRRYGSVDVVLARVIKADGTEVVVDEDLITEGTPPQVSAMNIFETDFRELTIVFPNLEVGDAIETITRLDYEPLIENGFNGMYFAQSTSPIEEVTITIVGPVDMPLKHIVRDGDLEFTESTADGKHVYSWKGTNIRHIEPEVAMPSPAQFATRVVVSTIHTWEELSNYLWEMTDEKCVAEEPVKELVAEITEGLDSTEDKIRAIHYWITENVRYLGIAMDRGAYLEPHFAAYTLEKEYGICRDKAVLMVTMLEEIGVPAWVVIINVNRLTDVEIPNTLFEHGIVAIEGPDGEYLYIDPTQETSREVYSTYVGDRWALVLTEGGTEIRKAPHVPASANSGDVVDTSILTEDGAISGTVTITGTGMYEEILRVIAKSAQEEQLRMAWEGAVQELYPGAEMTSFEVTDYEDLYEPIRITVGYAVDDYALEANPYFLFRVPAATGQFDFLSEAMVGRLTGLAERKYPLALSMTLGLEEKGQVVIPEGYTVASLPDNVSYQEGVIGLEIEYTFVPAARNDGEALIKYHRTFGIDSFQVSPKDYLALRDAMKLAGKSTRGEVILKKVEG